MTTVHHDVIHLWPGAAPGSESWEQVESEVTVPWGAVVRNVTQPSLTVYPAARPNGAAVIVAPGGAWHFLAIHHEGWQVAEWLAGHGITAFVLKYRLLRTGDNMDQQVGAFMADPAVREAALAAHRPLGLADGQQAVRMVRQRCGEWGVDPHQIGFMGFSAGGELTTLLATNYTPDCRPDFVAPIYPAVFGQVQAASDAPPLFLCCAADDEMAARSSLLLYQAWKAAHRPVEMHIYGAGSHGFGMRTLGLPCDTWIERCADWLKSITLASAGG